MNQPGFIVLWFFAAILRRIQSPNWRRQGLATIVLVCADKVCTIGSVSSALGCPYAAQQNLEAMLQNIQGFCC
jgi:hypothetical protein